MVKHCWYDRTAAVDPTFRRYVTRELRGAHAPSPWARLGTSGRHVVEFLRGGRSECGVLLQHGLRTCRVLDRDGREERIINSKIVEISPLRIDISHPRHDLAKTLTAIDRELEDAKASINVAELWELVRTEDEEWSLDDFAGIIFGSKPVLHGRIALFRALEEGAMFQRHGEQYTALPPEKVARHREEQHLAELRDEHVHEVAEWLRRVSDGEGPAPARPIGADEAVEALAGRILFGDDHHRAAKAVALTKRAHLHTHEAVFRLLVKLGHWDEDENLDLLRHEVPVTFTEEAIAEAGKARWIYTAAESRQFRVRRVYSFARDDFACERAFSIGRSSRGITVGIHLASPPLVLQHGGAILRAAAERVSALALPDRFLPMLPALLLEKAALTDAEMTPCLTLRLVFGPGYRLTDYAFEVRKVRVTRPLSWDDVDGHCADDPGLRKLRALARELRKGRTDSGAIVLCEPSVDPVVTDNGLVELRRREADGAAQLIDEELTILANTLAGAFCETMGIPGIHRAQGSRAEVVATSTEWDPVACYRLKRRLPKAGLQLEPAHHHALGARAYVPVTEPCRRYTDLLMHQQILASLDITPDDVRARDELAQLMLHTALGRSVSRDLERNARRYWLLRYLEPRVGENVAGVILDVFASDYLVELTDTRLRVTAPISPSRPLCPGARVTVRLAKVSARGDCIRGGNLRLSL